MNGRSERDPLTLGRIALHCRPGDDCRATDAGVAQLADALRKHWSKLFKAQKQANASST